jgi:glycosyltransferase involved in cell wall biosynthesis
MGTIKNKGHILFWYDNWCFGGAERVTQLLANYFASQNWAVTLVVGQRLNFDYPLDKRIQIEELSFDLVAISNYFESAINNKKFDFYSIQGFWGDIEKTIIDILDTKKVPFSVTDHSNYFFVYSYNNLHFQERLKYYQKTSVITVLSHVDEIIYKTLLPQQNVFFIPNPNTFETKSIDTAKFNPDNKNILAVGRLQSVKSFNRLLQVFALIYAKYNDWTLTIVGHDGGELANLKQQAKSLGIDKAVMFQSFTKDISSFYKNSSIFVMTSELEGWPMVLVEAQQHALPSVVFDLPCFQTLIPKEVGYIVAQDDIVGMAEKIHLLIENPVQRKEMGIVAYEHIQQYDLQNIGKYWENMIGSIRNHQEIKKYADYNREQLLAQSLDFSMNQYNRLYVKYLYKPLVESTLQIDTFMLEQQHRLAFKLLKLYFKFFNDLSVFGLKTTVKKSIMFICQKIKTKLR